MNEEIIGMDVDTLCREEGNEQTQDALVERLYGHETVNPAQSSDTPWVRDPEYFERYVVCGCGGLRVVTNRNVCTGWHFLQRQQWKWQCMQKRGETWK